MAVTETVSEMEKKVLDYLEKCRKNPLNNHNTPVSVRILSQDLEISKEDIFRTCEKLVQKARIQKIDAAGQYPYYRTE